MKKPTLENLKTTTKHYAPTIITGIAVGATVTAVLYHRMYNPKDKIAIQFPAGVLEKMQETGKGVVMNSNVGRFTLNYIPND